MDSAALVSPIASLSASAPKLPVVAALPKSFDRHQGLRLRRVAGAKKPVAPLGTTGTRRCSTWRMQVADPLDSFRDSFGNECAVEKRARQTLEMSDGYKRIIDELGSAKAEMACLVAAEKYEEACEVRDRASSLQLQKRLLEISAKPRITYRIGDLVIHKRYGYRGVIYGHDPQCSAPKEWKDAMKVDLLEEGPNQPFYHVLVDTRDRPGGMSTYVAQENLVVQQDPRPVLHPWVQKFFLGFQEDTYIPGQRLRQVYPNDW